MALGSQRGGIVRMVLREAHAPILAGIVLGTPCALAAARLVSHGLFGVLPHDPATFAAACAALLAVGLAAA